MNLRTLVACADSVGLLATPYKIEIEAIDQIDGPCILHWDFAHYVVLVRVRRGLYYLNDPAVGARCLTKDELSLHYTGVAIQFVRAANFFEEPDERKGHLRGLLASTSGLYGSLGKIGILALLLEAFLLISPLLIQFAIDDVVGSNDVDLLITLSIGFGLVATMQHLLSYARSLLIAVLTQGIIFQWVTMTFAHLLKLPVAFFERRRLGDLVSRFGSLWSIQQVLTISALEALVDGIMLITSLVLMLLYSPKLTVITLSAFLLQTLVRMYAYYPIDRMSRERIVASAQESTYFLETLRSITTIKLNGGELFRRTSWQGYMRGVQVLDVRKSKADVTVSTIVGYVGAIEAILVIAFGVHYAVGTSSTDRLFTVGMLFVYIAYKTQFLLRANSVVRFLVDLRMVRMHGERLSDIHGEEAEESTLAADFKHLTPTIELKGVGFRYDGSETWIFREVDLSISAGDSVAITGPSGAGKTTLLKLILGIISPVEGVILYGGVDIRKLGLENYRRLIGSVMQDDSLLTGTIADNISFFSQEISQAWIEECATAACIHDEIIALPMAYNTLIGDLGSGLSGGQKQRVLLARALCRRPKLLVLDEATSHLDAKNELGVNVAFRASLATRVFAAHRQSTIENADYAFIVAGGTVRALNAPELESSVDGSGQR
jgi:ATP-binding cassette subfamily B protein RaxB